MAASSRAGRRPLETARGARDAAFVGKFAFVKGVAMLFARRRHDGDNSIGGDMISLPGRPLLIIAGMQLLTVAGCLMAASMVLRLVVAIGWRGLAMAFFCYGLVATFVVLDLGRHAPHQRFGVANSVTLARAALTALLWGVVGETVWGSADLNAALRWLLALAATAALILDGLDGWLARRSGMASDFGADFDLEVDSLFVLALSLLVYETAAVGVWVLANGLLRYIFVVAGWLLPTFAAPLLPLKRRKVICVVQCVVLIAALAPALPAGVAAALCLFGVALLSYSFGADILWLWLNKLGRA
jgi:phosphatidylglycerophosphate synthase